jgi:hypothetical protein
MWLMTSSQVSALSASLLSFSTTNIFSYIVFLFCTHLVQIYTVVIYSFRYRKERVDLDLSGTHKNASESSNFDADITGLCIINYLLCSISVIEIHF